MIQNNKNDYNVLDLINLMNLDTKNIKYVLKNFNSILKNIGFNSLNKNNDDRDVDEYIYNSEHKYSTDTNISKYTLSISKELKITHR